MKKQIEIYAPNIVICGGTGELVRDRELLGYFEKWSVSERGIKYSKVNNVIVISLPHPQASISAKKMFWNLVLTIREAKM